MTSGQECLIHKYSGMVKTTAAATNCLLLHNLSTRVLLVTIINGLERRSKRRSGRGGRERDNDDRREGGGGCGGDGRAGDVVGEENR